MFKQPSFQCFQCSNEENIIDTGNILFGQHIQNEEPKTNVKYNKDESGNFTFFDRCYAESVWFDDIKILFLLARKNILQLEQAAVTATTSFQSTNYFHLRRNICEFVVACRVISLRLKNDHSLNDSLQIQLTLLLKNLINNVKRIEQLPDYVIFNPSKSFENENQQASYNFLHLCLDLHWMFLTFEYRLEDDPVTKNEIFEKKLILLLTDLINVSLRKFDRLNSDIDVIKQPAFLCSCFKELWLLIQLFVEDLNSQHFSKDFWHYFNSVMKKELNLSERNNVKNALKCLWLLYHVAQIQAYNSSGIYIGVHHTRIVSNYSLVQQCLKCACNSPNTITDRASEQLMSACLQLVAAFQNNCWKNDFSFDLLQQLWEYFYKRIDTLTTDTCQTTHSFHAYEPCDYMLLIDRILNFDLNASEVNSSSYEIFLCLLGKYLLANPSHWPKFKGRIYSKLPATKLAEYSDIGLHNLMLLFFLLAYTVNFNELTDKLQSLLSQFPAAKSETSVVIWCAHVSLLLMRAQRGLSLNAEICEPILLAVHSVSADRSRSHLLRIYIDGIKRLVDSNSKLQCQEYVFIGGWISRYLQWCSRSDACYLLDIFIKLIEKLRQIDNSQKEWWDALETHLVSALILLSCSQDAPQQTAELAAHLLAADDKRYKMLLEHMIADSVHINLATKFLHAILEENRNSLQHSADQQSLMIQVWIRIAVLNTDKSSLIELTQTMFTLSEWSNIIGAFELSNEDPLYVVIRLAGARSQDTLTFIENTNLKRWFEIYFGRMDRWMVPVLLAAERGDSAQLVLRMYTCAALLFFHCAPSLYIRNKNTCLLYRLTSTLLLPSTVLTNKRPAAVILVALRRTWHLFMRGFTRLDYKNDNYIERTMKDMVVRYVPHMYDASSPISRCLDDEFDIEVTAFVLEKIATTFFIHKTKNPQQFLTQALKLTLELCRIRTANRSKTEILVRTMLPALFELLTFIDDAAIRQLVFQIIKSIKSNQYYTELREIVRNSIVTIIEKYLPFYSANVYRLLETLVTILSSEVENIIPKLKEAIRNVESMRGVGYDNTLRKGLHKIQELVKQQTK